MEAILNAHLPIEIAAVISNEPSAKGLTTAQARGIPTAVVPHKAFATREAFDAALAALPKGPGRYNPRRFPERAVQRRNTIIELMRREGVIPDSSASLAKAYPMRLVRRRSTSSEVAPYFVEYVRRLLEEKYGKRLYEHPLKVYTTLDLELQGAAERALDRQLRTVESGQVGAFPHRTYEQIMARAAAGGQDESRAVSAYLQGAFVAVDPRSGAVRALVADVSASYAVDPGRVYAAGHSNGGIMALRLACEEIGRAHV